MSFQKSFDWDWSISTLSTNFKFIRPPYIVLILCNGCPEKNRITFFPLSVRTNRSCSQVDLLCINTTALPFCDVCSKGVDIKEGREKYGMRSISVNFPFCVFCRAVADWNTTNLSHDISQNCVIVMHLIVELVPEHHHHCKSLKNSSANMWKSFIFIGRAVVLPTDRTPGWYAA